MPNFGMAGWRDPEMMDWMNSGVQGPGLPVPPGRNAGLAIGAQVQPEPQMAMQAPVMFGPPPAANARQLRRQQYLARLSGDPSSYTPAQQYDLYNNGNKGNFMYNAMFGGRDIAMQSAMDANTRENARTGAFVGRVGADTNFVNQTTQPFVQGMGLTNEAMAQQNARRPEMLGEEVNQAKQRTAVGRLQVENGGVTPDLGAQLGSEERRTKIQAEAQANMQKYLEQQALRAQQAAFQAQRGGGMFGDQGQAPSPLGMLPDKGVGMMPWKYSPTDFTSRYDLGGGQGLWGTRSGGYVDRSGNSISAQMAQQMLQQQRSQGIPPGAPGGQQNAAATEKRLGPDGRFYEKRADGKWYPNES